MAPRFRHDPVDDWGKSWRRARGSGRIDGLKKMTPQELVPPEGSQVETWSTRCRSYGRVRWMSMPTSSAVASWRCPDRLICSAQDRPATGQATNATFVMEATG